MIILHGRAVIVKEVENKGLLAYILLKLVDDHGNRNLSPNQLKPFYDASRRVSAHLDETHRVWPIAGVQRAFPVLE